MAPGLATGRRKMGRPKSNASDEGNIKLKRETFELVRAYYKIRNDNIRQAIRFMVKALASKGYGAERCPPIIAALPPELKLVACEERLSD
jgi:hypothetical protein